MKKERCHDCDCLEGELHEFGCDNETCPFCGGQLLSCDCCYELLGIDCSKGTYAYENGLTEEQWNQWIDILLEKGRIPYVLIPNMCGLCGKLWPDMFMMADEEWEKYVIPPLQYEELCSKCFQRMKKMFPDGWERESR